MTQRDQIKLIKAKYRLFRVDDSHPMAAIKHKDKTTSDWKIFKKYESKAARNRAFDELMQNDKNIEA